MLLFRIKNTKTGQYSKGGHQPWFSKKGKIWNGRGPFHGHLALFNDDRHGLRLPKEYKDCVVEVMVVGEQPTCTQSVEEYCNSVGYSAK